MRKNTSKGIGWDFVSGITVASYILLSSYGILIIKTAQSIYSIQMYIGTFIYICGSVIWLAILRRLPLSVAFPVASGLMIIGIAFVGALFLNEELGLYQLIGGVAIMIGVWLIKD